MVTGLRAVTNSESFLLSLADTPCWDSERDAASEASKLDSWFATVQTSVFAVTEKFKIFDSVIQLVHVSVVKIGSDRHYFSSDDPPMDVRT